MIHCLTPCAPECPTELKMSIKYDASHFVNGGYTCSPEAAGYYLPPPPLMTPMLPPLVHLHDQFSQRMAGNDSSYVPSMGSDKSDIEDKQMWSMLRNDKQQSHSNTYDRDSKNISYGKALPDPKYKHSSDMGCKDNKQIVHYKSPQYTNEEPHHDMKERGKSFGSDYSRHRSYRSYEAYSRYLSQTTGEIMNENEDERPGITRALSLQMSDDIETRFTGSLKKRSLSYSPDKEDGMMEVEKEGAINLSTANGKDSTDGLLLNGEVKTNGENGHISQGHGNESSQVPDKVIPPSSTSSTGSASKRKKPPALSVGSEPPLPSPQSILMLAAQHGLSLQQIQQLQTQQQQQQTAAAAVAAASLPQQVQQMMQHQSLVMHQQQQQQQKVQEIMLQQLNEQLQMNVLQQSQLMQQQQQEKTKTGGSKQLQQELQQLAVQQTQLIQQIQQIQLQQRQLLLACLVQPPGGHQGMMTPAEIQQLWKEVAGQSSAEDALKPGMNGVAMGTSLAGLLPGNQGALLQNPMFGVNGMVPDGFLLPGALIGQPPISIKQEDGTGGMAHPLYRHGLCKWPGCDTQCEDFQAFSKHIDSEHQLDDRSTAQARVQMQVVSQLELQLNREKELLHAMMQHLHMKPQRDREREREEREAREAARDVKPPQVSPPMSSPVIKTSISSPVKPHIPVSSPPVPIAPAPAPVSMAMPLNPAATGLPPLIIPPQAAVASISKPQTPKSHSEPQTPTSAGPMRRRVSDKCNLPISAEIQRNRDFYKNTDVRPPFTYASLIRQAIIESPHKQLTLNEVYQWFQTTFAYFRRNEATWKNAVRHNLSLHKCFMRVENVKGAVWTVDEVEFYKRRPQKLSGAIVKSPSLTPDPSVYGESINASLKAALEQSSLMLGHRLSNGSLSSMDEGAEDLSMKSYSNSNNNSPSREEMMFFVKQEGLPEADIEGGSPREGPYSGGSPREGPFSDPSEEMDDMENNQGMDLSQSEAFHNNTSQSEALNMTKEAEFPSGSPSGSSPCRSRESPVGQFPANQSVFPTSLHSDEAATSVSHSIAS